MRVDVDIASGVIPEFDHPGGWLYLQIMRCTSLTPDLWPDATEIAVTLEAFVDGEWQIAGGLTAIGGVHIYRSGDECPVTNGRWPCPPARVRGTITGNPPTTAFIESR